MRRPDGRRSAGDLPDKSTELELALAVTFAAAVTALGRDEVAQLDEAAVDLLSPTLLLWRAGHGESEDVRSFSKRGVGRDAR